MVYCTTMWHVSHPSFLFASRLTGNPACSANISFCTLKEKRQDPYSTSLGPCGAISCATGQLPNPETSQNCACTTPFEGVMIFQAPAFSDMTSPELFQQLESTLIQNLSLAPRSVALSDVDFSPGAPLIFRLMFFPVSEMGFNRSEVIRISSALANQIYKAPTQFGPYYFKASPYFASMHTA